MTDMIERINEGRKMAVTRRYHTLGEKQRESDLEIEAHDELLDRLNDPENAGRPVEDVMNEYIAHLRYNAEGFTSIGRIAPANYNTDKAEMVESYL